MAQDLLGGRYGLIEKIGSGGMADIYRALDHQLQREVAVKILRDPLAQDQSFQESFLHEARAAANLSHPNIVTIFDFGRDEGTLYIVMEYIAGTDLKTLIRRRKHLNPLEAVELMKKISDGVGYAHRAGLVHCDLKPQNIMVTPDNKVKITDFGVSRALATIQPDEHSDIVWGSPQYFSPEQASGGAPSPASDVYSLGAILYEMITGQPPFVADTAADLAQLHLTAEPIPPRSIEASIPEPLQQIVLKVLAKEPSARYRTADQLGRILTNFNLNAIPEERSSTDGELDNPDLEQEKPKPLQKTAVTSEMDWILVALGLVAFLTIGGLIPLWLWVCLLYPSCPINPG
ncbi:MAG: serine/threonine protein kinase [Anaerolineales bacterium]|nr:MAG: serine/threonine protein kinase [Anaerolineales bacterium]